MKISSQLASYGFVIQGSTIGEGNFGIDVLPPIVRASIEECVRICLFGTDYILVKPTRNLRATTIERLLGDVSSAVSLPALAYFDSLSKHMRHSLVERSVPFVCDDGQFFIPGALNLLPAVSKDAVSEPKNLSPSAQLVFLWWLYSDNEATAAEISEGLGLSKASVLRGCEALVAAGLLSKRIGGAKKRTALFSIPDYLSFAEKGTRLFGDPIEDDFYVSASDASGLPLCGESALARRSMLVAPHVPMYASSRKEGRVLAELARDQNEPIELAMVRVLSYDPCAMAHDGVVDAFTMWKTVDVDDERTRLGLDEALGGYRWYASQE